MWLELLVLAMVVLSDKTSARGSFYIAIYV